MLLTGMDISRKNHCNVAILIRKNINSFKMQSLLELTGTEERLLKAVSYDELEQVLSLPMDYKSIDIRIKELSKESDQYLLNALGGINE